ncbi:hypothetical protein D7036_12595, partial [Aquimarina sp. BL5]
IKKASFLRLCNLSNLTLGEIKFVGAKKHKQSIPIFLFRYIFNFLISFFSMVQKYFNIIFSQRPLSKYILKYRQKAFLFDKIHL